MLLKHITYLEGLHYKNRILYIILGCTIAVASLFLILYFLWVPFFPAIMGHIIYISSSMYMFILLRKKQYLFVRYFVIIAHLIQLTLAVYLWFSVDTGFGNYYFMVPLAAFLIMDYGDRKQRFFSIIVSMIAAMLYLFSETLTMTWYLCETTSSINLIFEVISILTMMTPLTFVFAIFSKDIFKTQTELEFLASTDTLTQIQNRRSLYEVGNEAFFIARKYNYVFSIILMDIDFFKKVNDTYGHQVGDQLLQQLTERISENVRKEDTFSRYGGEEFAILLNRTTTGEAFTIANKLLSLIRDDPFIIESIPIQLTISIGLVQYEREFKDFDHIMKVADTALYCAKDNGRDRIVVGRL